MEELLKFMEELKIEGLGKDRLEELHSAITNLDAVLRVELIPIEKEEALFFTDKKYSKEWFVTGEGNKTEPKRLEISDIEIKRMWRASKSGQREIELNQMLKITPKLLQSCKVKLYNHY